MSSTLLEKNSKTAIAVMAGQLHGHQKCSTCVMEQPRRPSRILIKKAKISITEAEHTHLTAGAVNADTPVTVTASYTNNSITKTTTAVVMVTPK